MRCSPTRSPASGATWSRGRRPPATSSTRRPGEGHKLVAYEHAEPMSCSSSSRVRSSGWTRTATATGIFDVHDYIEMCREHYEKVGLGAAYVDTCSAEARGAPMRAAALARSAGPAPGGAGGAGAAPRRGARGGGLLRHLRQRPARVRRRAARDPGRASASAVGTRGAAHARPRVLRHGGGVGRRGGAVGHRVAVEPEYRCGTCEYCRSGQYNLCRSIGLHRSDGRRRDGRFGAVVPSYICTGCPTR